MRKRIENFYLKTGMDSTSADIFSLFTTIIIISFILVRIGFGMRDANNPNDCKAHSINDVLLSPAYALGCNLAKDRFDLKLN